jgi:nifR3 family TIM-barrel protein
MPAPLKPLLKSRTILAPMAGITDVAFRTLMSRRGSGASVTELISADGLIRLGKKTLELAAFQEEERPVGIQLFGGDPEIVSQAVEIVQKLGADFLDMNFGCPVPKVVRKGAGAAMTRDPEQLLDYLTRIKKDLSIPLTIKIRSGWDAHSINALEIAQVAEEVGCSWIAIHGRTRAQGYAGLADWKLIRKVATSVSIPVIGNGDILDAKTLERRLQESGCAAVMVGRGMLRNPWMFLEHQALKAGDSSPSPHWSFQELLEEHHQLLIESTSDYHATLQLKKFSMWYSFGFPGSRAFRRQVFQQKSLEKVLDLARHFFASVAHLSVHSKDSQPFLKGGHG